MSAKHAEYARAVRKLINSKLKVQAPPPFIRGEKPRSLNQPPPRKASHFDEKYLREVRYRLFGTLYQDSNIKKGNKVLKARTKGHVVGRDGYYGKEYKSISKGVHNNNYWPGDTTRHRRNKLQEDDDWIPPDMEEINHTSWASLVDVEHYELPEIGWKKNRTPHSTVVPHLEPPTMDDDLANIKSKEDMEAWIKEQNERDERIERGEEEKTDEEKMYDYLFYTPKISQEFMQHVADVLHGDEDEQQKREEELLGVEGDDAEDGRWRNEDGEEKATDFAFDQEEFDRLFKEGENIDADKIEGHSDNVDDPK